ASLLFTEGNKGNKDSVLRQPENLRYLRYLLLENPFSLSSLSSVKLHGCFSSQIFWKRGSPRKGSQNGSSLRRAGVIGAGPNFKHAELARALCDSAVFRQKWLVEFYRRHAGCLAAFESSHEFCVFGAIRI